MWLSIFLEKSVLQTAEPLHGHPHRQVMQLDMGRADVAHIGIACHRSLDRAVAFAGALFPLGRVRVWI
jgi:hypothetical protein